LRVWRHVGTATVALIDFSATQVGGLANSSDHLFLWPMAMDRVVRRVVFHSALEVGRHHADGDRRAVGVIDACYMNSPRGVQSRQHAVLLCMR